MNVIDFVDHDEIYFSFYFYNNPGIPKSGSADKYGAFERFTVLCWWFWQNNWSLLLKDK